MTGRTVLRLRSRSYPSTGFDPVVLGQGSSPFGLGRLGPGDVGFPQQAAGVGINKNRYGESKIQPSLW